MKRLLTLLLLFFCFVSSAQVNFVKNSGFELYNHCPDFIDNAKYADFWMGLDTVWAPPDWAHIPYGVSEYCHRCATYPAVTVPVSTYFYQYPHSGNGFAHVQMFFNGPANDPQARDYLQGHLSNLLVAGQSYCVSFYTNLTESSVYAINKIGAYLDDGTIDTTHNPGYTQTHCIPQIASAFVISDTMHWIKVQGSFIANGTERLITIGNFTDWAHSIVMPAPGRDTTGLVSGHIGAYAWYLVDDICVMRSDANISAGADKVITGIDSVTIGDTLDSYLPTYWYANGTLIDSNTAWLRVRPDTTTMYVVELSRCGGDNITDTVWVFVGALFSNAPVYNTAAITLSPNPSHGLLIFDGAAHGKVTITDMVGREVLHTTVTTAYERIDISGIVPGLYMAQVVMPDGGRKCVRVVISEP